MRIPLCILMLATGVAAPQLTAQQLAAQQFGTLLNGLLPDRANDPTRQSTRAVATDWDGDGALDLAVLAPGTAGIELLHNDGEGRFVLAHILPEGQGASSFTFGDVDGDGDADLLIGRNGPPNGATNLLLRNDGNGVFTDVTATWWPNAADSAWQILAVDLDGDQDLDLVVCNSLSYWGTYVPEQNRLYRNDGTGHFTDITASALPHTPGFHAFVVAEDFDGDGRTDLAFANHDPYHWPSPPWSSPLRLFRNTGTGFVEMPGPIATQSPQCTDFLAFDADGDGDRDLLVLNGVPQLYWNVGAFQFVRATGLPPSPPRGSVACVATDVDGDQDLDVLFVDGYERNHPSPSATASLWENLGGGTFAARTSWVPTAPLGAISSPAAIVAFDADGDGDQDVWVSALPRDRLWLNDGTGRFVQLESFDFDGGTADGFLLGDLDGDHHRDLLAYWSQTAAVDQVRWHQNDGLGTFARHWTSVLPKIVNSRVNAIAVADFDRDGDLDVYAATGPSFPAAQDRLALNLGNGQFLETTASSLPPEQQDDRAVAAGDLDGDGDLDLVVGSAGQDRLYLNQGNAVFVDATAAQLPPDQVLTTGVALIDIDGDGDLDLVLAGDGAAMRLYENNGLGTFTDVSARMPTTVWNVHSLATGDVDGDGDLDVMIGGFGMPITLLRNLGGNFAAVAQVPTTQWIADGLRLVDFDGDGDLDLFVGSGPYERSNPVMLANDGSGTFTPVSMFPAGSSTCTRPAFGDVDGDGDLEMPGFRNLQRQLHNELPPRVGRHGRLVLHAQSSSSAPAVAVLMLSPVRAAVPISFGVIGTLELDAQMLFVHSFHQIAGTGQPTTVSYLVPNQPGLLGLSLWAQGIFHDGGPTSHWRLGNLVELSIQL